MSRNCTASIQAYNVYHFPFYFCSYLYNNNEYKKTEINNSHIENLKRSVTHSRNAQDNLAKQLNGIHHYQYHKLCTIIGITTPQNITLNNLIINPLHKQPQQDKELQIDQSTTIIKGQCDSINTATDYIDLLQKKYFNGKVEMNNAEYNKRNETYEFTIKIKL